MKHHAHLHISKQHRMQQCVRITKSKKQVQDKEEELTAFGWLSCYLLHACLRMGHFQTLQAQCFPTLQHQGSPEGNILLL